MAGESKAYKEYKVSELKELLKKRGLSTSGTKTELIARLENNDVASDGEGIETGPEKVESPKNEETENPAENNPAIVPTEPSSKASEAGAEAVSNITQEPEEPVTDESITSKALAELETRISRKKKFNEPTEDLEIQMKRIKRFGAMAVRDANTKVSKTHARGRQGRSHRSRRRSKSNKAQN